MVHLAQVKLMATVSVPIFVESRYKVSRKKIKEKVGEVVVSYGITGAVEVSVAIVGSRKMRSLNKKYRNIDATTNVLSFSQIEGKGPMPVPVSDVLFLGDVVISYPEVIKEAARENMLVDDKVLELVEHGVLHLLGISHE